MGALKAVVKDGRLVLDEPTELPNGTEVVLAVIDEDDDMSDEERAALHRELELSMEDVEAGNLVDADQVLSELRAQR